MGIGQPRLLPDKSPSKSLAHLATLAETHLSRPFAVRSVVLLGSLAMACAHATDSARQGAAPGHVELKFAWPEGFQSHVLIAHESRRSGADPTVLIARQRLVTEKKGNEIWVITRDIAARGNEPDLESTVKINEALMQVVTPDGRFRRAEGLDQALSAIPTTTSDDREKARQALIRSTAFDWELLVGAWAGEKLAAGQVRRKQVKAYVPDLQAIESVLEVEYGLEARVPCKDEDTVRRCVELSYRAHLAPEDQAATVERLRRATSSKANEPVPEDVHAELEMVLVTEPDTLIPHRMSQREHRRLRLALPGGRVVETEGRSEDTYVFSDREQQVPAPENAPSAL